MSEFSADMPATNGTIDSMREQVRASAQLKQSIKKLKQSILSQVVLADLGKVLEGLLGGESYARVTQGYLQPETIKDFLDRCEEATAGAKEVAQTVEDNRTIFTNMGLDVGLLLTEAQAILGTQREIKKLLGLHGDQGDKYRVNITEVTGRVAAGDYKQHGNTPSEVKTQKDVIGRTLATIHSDAKILLAQKVASLRFLVGSCLERTRSMSDTVVLGVDPPQALLKGTDNGVVGTKRVVIDVSSGHQPTPPAGHSSGLPALATPVTRAAGR